MLPVLVACFLRKCLFLAFYRFFFLFFCGQLRRKVLGASGSLKEDGYEGKLSLR